MAKGAVVKHGDVSQRVGVEVIRARGVDVEGGIFDTFDQAVDVGGGEGGGYLILRDLFELEEFFGVTLMKRHGKGITLTPAGQILLRVSREIFIALEDFQSGSEQIFELGISG